METELKAGRIVIVEDVAVIRLHLQHIVSKDYLIAGTYSSGESLLAEVDVVRPDLILMDIILDGELNGLETASLIKNLHGNIPIIFLTALTDDQTIKQAKELIPYGYIMKPFNEREVLTGIEMALHRHAVEQKFDRLNSKFLTVINAINDCIIQVNTEYKVVYINPAAEKLLGWSMVEINEDMRIDQLLPFLSQERFTQFFSTDRVGSNRDLSEFLILDRHGNEQIIGDGHICALHATTGNMSGWVIVFREIKSKVLERAYREEVEKLRLANIIEGQELERSRLARELHDGVGQILGAIRMHLNLLSDDHREVQEAIVPVQDMVMELIDEITTISENLVPSKLRNFDLVHCLRSLCKSFNQPPVIHFNALDIPENLSQSTRVNIYRIVQESLHNAQKYAQAENITVQLLRDEDTLRITIEDDGIGMSLPGAPAVELSREGRGLNNMRSRVQIMNGTINWDSTPAYGTHINIEIPLNQQLIQQL